jgi:hypothetical protein
MIQSETMSAHDYLNVGEIAAHKTAMQAVRDKTRNAIKELEENLARDIQEVHDREKSELESLIEEQEKRVVLRRIYHEAPHDIMELIVMQFSNVEHGWGKGGMNRLRLVSKRLMRVVEPCATSLSFQQPGPGSSLLPLGLVGRCLRIEHISYLGNSSISSLEGCPNGLKSLFIINKGHSLQSLEPLRGCTELESLKIHFAGQISDLSPLTLCTRLKKLELYFSAASDLSVLSSMPLLEEVDLQYNRGIMDLLPLAKGSKYWPLSTMKTLRTSLLLLNAFNWRNF